MEEEMRLPLMFDALMRKLKSLCRKGAGESDSIRDRNPRGASPDVRRALKRLQHDCEEDSGDKADAK